METKYIFVFVFLLIDLINSVITSNFIKMADFPTWISNCDSHSLALLDLFISSEASISSTMAFPLLGNSIHVVFSVSIDLPSNSQWDILFHCVAYDYSHAD